MELIERDAYLADLAEHLAAAAAGHGRLVLVGGEAGVGKTSLVRAFSGEHARDARVVLAACDGLFTPQPLGPLFEVADQLGFAVAVDAPRHEVFGATLDALRPRPTVVVLEDVHWADEATLDLLRFLGRRLDRTAALLIATYRDDELAPSHPLRVVLGDVSSHRRITLPPLSEAGVRELAQGSGVDAHELYRLTGGNPFFATEVLAARDAGVPQSIRDAVLARAGRLSTAARSVLDAAAVVGARVRLKLLEDVLREPPRALDECLAVGVLQARGSEVAFRHELARQAVAEAIDPLRRVELHVRVLAALRPTSDAALLAHHAEAAGDAAAVLEYAPAAAREAGALGAHREAAAQYGRALRFADALPAEAVAKLLERRAYECYLTDQIDDALAAQREALDRYRALGDHLKEGDMLRAISRLSYLAARIDDARATALEAVSVLERFPAGRELVLAYANLAHLAQIDLRIDSTLAWGRRAVALGQEVGAGHFVIDALISMGNAEAVAGRGTAGLQQALELARTQGTDDCVARLYGGLAFAAVRQRDWASADRWLEEGLRYTTERDLDSRRLHLLGWRAAAALEQGRWNEAAADCDVVLRHPYARLNRVWALIALGCLRARRGDPDTWGPLDEALALTRGEAPQKLVPLALVRAEAAYLEGDLGRALAETGSLPADALVDRWIAGKLAVWRRRLGATAEDAGTIPEPYELELAGDHAAAGAEWDLRGCPFDAAMALSGSGDEDDLRRAHERLLALGARPAAAIVARQLRERGVRGVARGPRRATRDHPAGLTRRELEVLGSLAEGLTNAEIAAKLVISEKTVAHHVSAVLGKLGVRSRYEAARLAAEDRELVLPR